MFPKTLVCFFGQLRATHLTYDSLEKHVIKPLNADVMLSVATDKSKYDLKKEDKLAKIAKYIHTYDDTNIDYNVVLDDICNSKDQPSSWRDATHISDNWLGGLNGRKGANMHIIYNKYLMKRKLMSIKDKYDWFVITRTDLMWLADHPDVSVLDKNNLYIPSGQDWGGYNDRHIVCSRENLKLCLGMLDTLLFRTQDMLDMCNKYMLYSLNAEKYLMVHFFLYDAHVERFPSVCFLTGDDKTPTKWSVATYDPVNKYHYKYKEEMDEAIFNSIRKTR